MFMVRHKFLKLVTAAATSLFVASTVLAEEQSFAGNYELVSATRKILDTGQTEDTFGKKPKGLAMYGTDGHFIILISYDGRPKPESIEKTTDQQRADLHRMMTAYGGTYTFDGSKVVHRLDISWNEVWAGTTNIRDVQRDGDRVIFTARPAPFASDGKMSVVTVVWKKLN
jgi:hypothetical protein